MVQGAPRGVSVTQRSGSYRVRWRQREQQEDGTVAVRWATQTRDTEAEAIRLAWEVREALDRQGYWTPDGRGPMVRPADVDLEAVIAVAWMRWQRETRGARPATLSALASALHRFLPALREVLDIAPGKPIPCSALTIASFSATNGLIAARHKGGTPYQTAGSLYAMWCWATDVGTWPTLAPAPRTSALVLPRPHAYAAPSVEPRTDECDAMIRRLAYPPPQSRRSHRGPTPLRMTIIQRYTGLRVEQVHRMWREDVDVDACTLTVRTGKSAREHAAQRIVPVSPWLIADLRAWLDAAPPGPLFKQVARPRNSTRLVTEAWEATVAAGEARRTVVHPPNRARPRPTHVLRALLQGVLGAARISDRVIDHLVGHAPRDTRGRSYVAPDWDQLVEAVALIPRIDWRDRASPDAGAPTLRLVRSEPTR